MESALSPPFRYPSNVPREASSVNFAAIEHPNIKVILNYVRYATSDSSTPQPHNRV
jgi:hypothetical protein